MAQNCREQIYSNDYQDYLVEHVGDPELLQEWYSADCYQIISDRFAVVYMNRDQVKYDSWSGVYIVPHAYGLLSSEEILEEMGVAQVQRMSYLGLYGQGVMIGFIDTGIDYTHPAFLNADGTSRIWRLWDQTIQDSVSSDGTDHTPEEFDFGWEYTTEELNEAIASDDPWALVPSRDENGHGTFLAGVACGNRDDSKGFSGVAPLVSICMVKCKEAKQNLREYYRVQGEEPCYAESDIMIGVRYLWNQAVKRRMPLVICVGMGTNLGGHNRGGMLGEMLSYYGDFRGTFVVTGVGNEANMSHHFRSGIVPSGESMDVELRVGSGRGGFTMEIWSDAPDLFSVGLISPSGEYSGKTVARLGGRSSVQFLFEQTTVQIEYLLISYESGDECIRLRFSDTQEGIWRIRVFNENERGSDFHIWLPIRNFITNETYFLQSDPDTTICDPANNYGVISAAFYNSIDRRISIDSGRGYNRIGLIKPDIAAPGIEILGPMPAAGETSVPAQERAAQARYGYQSGSSVSAALTAGTVALLVEWGMVRRNDISMDTLTVQKYLIQGANPAGGETPNRTWGNGLLNLYGVFDVLRPK